MPCCVFYPRRDKVVLSLLALLSLGGGTPAVAQEAPDPPPPLPVTADVRRTADGQPVLPLFFPVIGKCDWEDSFGAPRGGGKRKHEGQDLMAAQMTPVVACFSGTIRIVRNHGNAGNWITLTGENGWTAHYLHLNNDTPGTDDSRGGDEYAFAPGLQDGQWVASGQLLGWVGDSGNAEDAGCHLHFELHSPQGVVNAAASLRVAQKLEAPRPYLREKEIQPQKGEVRLDAVVRVVDVGRKVLAVSPIDWVSPEGKTTVQTTPTRKWLKVKDDAQFQRWGETDSAVSFSDLRPGDRVILLTYEAGKDKALTTYRVAVAPPWGTPIPATIAIATAPQEVPEPVTGPNLPPAVDPAILTPKPLESSPQPENRTASPRDYQLGARKEEPPTRLPGPKNTMARLLEQINYYRRESRMPDLKLSPELSQAAQAHSEAMANKDFLGHVDANGRTVGQRVEQTGYEASQLGECIAGSYDAPEKVLYYWMNRAVKDRRLLMDPAFTEIGIGYFHLPNDSGKVRVNHYWTVVLGRRE